MASKKEYEMRIRIGGRVDASLSRATQAAIKSIEGGLGKFESRVKSIAKVAGAAIIGMGTAATVMGSNFEAQMKTVQAISNASEADLDKLSEKAKEMGINTVFSATEAGKAMEYMAMAGWKTKDMTEGVAGIMNLAAASGEDLGMVSDIVTDALTAFGLKAKDAGHFSDVLAAAASNSNTNVAMLGESFQYVAPVAGSLGYKVEDVAVGLGLMANQGIKASMAGRALKNIMANMAKPSKEMYLAMEELGVSLTDGEGNMLSFMDLMKNLRSGFNDGNLSAEEFNGSLKALSEQLESGELQEEEYEERMDGLMQSMYGAGAADKARLAAMLGGKQAMAGLLAIVNSSEEDFNKLTLSIENSTGAAERMANIKLDNLKGDLKLAESALEGLGIQTYEDMKGPMREAVQLFSKSIQDLNNYIIKSGATKNIGRLMSKGLEGIKDAGKSIIEFGKFAMKHSSVILGLLSSMATGYAALKAIVVGNKIVSGISAISVAFSNPVTGAIAVATLAVAAIAGVTTALAAMRKEAGQRNLKEHFGNLSLSMKEVDTIAERLVSNKSLEGVRAAMQSFDEASTYMDSFTDSLSTVQKLNWQVSMGLSLSGDDNAAYQENVENMIDSLKQSALSEQYAMDMNLASLLGDNPDAAGVRESFNNYYSSVYSELERLGGEMRQAVNDAFQDGILDIDEAKHLEELEMQMAQMKAKLANDSLQSSFDVINASTIGRLDADSFKDVIAKTTEKADEAMATFAASQEKTLSSLQTQYREGFLSEGEFNRQYDIVLKSIQDNQGKTVGMAVSSLTKNIKGTYSTEMKTLMPELSEAVANVVNDPGHLFALKEQGGLAFNGIKDALFGGIKVDSATKEALSQLYEGLKPNVERLNAIAESYREQGQKIPDYVAEGLHEAATVGALTGDEASVWYLYGEQVGKDPNYQEVLAKLEAQGVEIPQAMLNGIQASTVLSSSGSIVRGQVQSSLDASFKDPINVTAKFNLEAIYEVSPNVLSNKARAEVQAKAMGEKMNLPKFKGLPAYASGGIIEKPTVATFAEDGPEAAIPLDGSSRAISLWQRAGEILGTLGKGSRASGNLEKLENSSTGGSGGVVVNFSPVQNFAAGTTPEDVQRVNALSFEEFKKMFDRYVKDGRRLGFT